MTDSSRKGFRFPVSHIPYLEKHRIFELFQEIARELVIYKPVDHVLYTKELIQNAASSRDVARIILLHVPKVNIMAIAEGISEKTGQVIISKNHLEICLQKEIESASSQDIARCLAYLVRKDNCYKKGWIMIDCIRCKEDATQLIHLGILPTHVIYPIAAFHPKLTDLLYCNVRSDWPRYRRNINGIRDTFKAMLREIHLNEKQLHEIVSECIDISRIRKSDKAIKPRIILLGPRGSGRKVQAKMLAQTFNIVFIDFEYLICQAWMSPSDLSKQLRQCKNEVCFHSELLAQVVNKRILEDDCLRRGWVLTGYPYTGTDFRYLDSLDTPPNRVIFLECDLNVCRERLRYRKINVSTGSSYNINDTTESSDTKLLKTHQRDNVDLINAELNYFCENYGPLRNYCGGTASVVNADQSERLVHECICAIIMRAPPQSPPRKGLTDLDTLSSESTNCDCIYVPSDVVDTFTKRI